MGLRGRVPEMHVSRIVERRRRLKAGDVPTEFGGGLIRLQHRGQRIPANGRAKTVLNLPIARVRRLFIRGDGIDVSSVGGEWQPGARAARRVDDARQNVVRTVRSLKSNDRVNRINPLP